MRTEGQIRHQLKQVTYRHLQRRLRDNFRSYPEGCANNVATPLGEGEGSFVGLCGALRSDGTPRNIPCDSRIAGCSEMARECPLFVPLLTKEQIKDEFKALVQSEDRGLIAAQYPDIAALLWVLDSLGGLPTVAEIDEHLEADAQVSPRWGNLWKRIKGE